MSTSLELEPTFQAPSMEAWQQAVRQTLKGADPAKKLRKRGVAGIDLQPLYDAGPEGVSLGRTGRWQVRQEVRCSSLKAANKQVRSELSLGGDAVWLRLDRSGRLGVRPDHVVADRGLCLISLDDLAAVLQRVDLSEVPVAIEAGANGLALLGGLVALAHRRSQTPDVLRGSVQGDPLACLVRDGGLPRGIDAAYDDLAASVRFVEGHCPQLRVVGLSTLPVHEAGAGPVDELAYLLAAFAETLRKLDARGISVEQVARRTEVTLGIGRDLFVELGKLRAARRLWMQMLEACGVTDVPMRLHARGADAVLTRRDPWVNMLRATQAGFVAATGGADSLTLPPYDAALGDSDSSARRIARNLQLLLAEEGHLGQVTDPAAGSYYVEQLTEQLARAAWARFQELERAGGLLQALSDGIVQDWVHEASADRERDVATRRLGVVGVSQNVDAAATAVVRPGFDEKRVLMGVRTRWEALSMVRRAPQQEAALRLALDALGSGTLDRVEAAANAVSLGACFADVAGGRTAEFVVRPLVPARHGSSWEALARRGAETPVFLAKLGSIPSHKARAAFATDLFAAGGLSVLSPGSSSAGDLASSGASIACICGSDADYDVVPALSASLKAAGARCVVVAGRRPDPDAWPDVDVVVHVGADVLTALHRVLDLAGGAA